MLISTFPPVSVVSSIRCDSNENGITGISNTGWSVETIAIYKQCDDSEIFIILAEMGCRRGVSNWLTK